MNVPSLPFWAMWPAKRRQLESDYGRCYGWFIEKNEEKIGELEYARWDSASQFWHEYHAIWMNNDFEIRERDSDAWISSRIAGYYRDVIVRGFISAPKPEGIVAIRGAFVPARHFKNETGAK